MFMSSYLPVNMKRMNCAVYSAEKVFPEEKLLAAYSFITDHDVEGIFMHDGNVSFFEAPETVWTIPEIYLAYEAYKQAAKNNFSYYIVKNDEDIPQLFVSKAFKGHRLLVNAFTMRTVLLGNKQLVNKVASLIDKTASSSYCIDLFNTLQSIELGSAKFLPALIYEKDTSDESLIVSPMLTPMSEVTNTYGADLIEEFRKVRENPNLVTESVKIDGGEVVRYDLPKSWTPMSTEHVDYIINTYDKIREKKSNYACIHDTNYNPVLYFSTNQRYLVNARTFECVIIKNQHTKSLLADFVRRNVVSQGEATMAWMLAKTE